MAKDKSGGVLDKTLKKIRIQDIKHEISMRQARLKKIPEQFDYHYDARSKHTLLMQSYKPALQLKTIKEIWEIDIRLEKLLDEYIQGKGIDNLTTNMKEWEPYGGSPRFKQYKKYSNKYYGRKKDDIWIIDGIIEDIIIGLPIVGDLWINKYYSSWNEAIVALTTESHNKGSKQTYEGVKQVIKPDKDYGVQLIFKNIDISDLKWTEIGLDFVSGDKLEIEIRTKKEKINVEQFGISKNQLYNTLFAFSVKHGYLDYKTLQLALKSTDNDVIQKAISRLRTHLKNFFGITNDPIKYSRKEQCYILKLSYFKCSYAIKADILKESENQFVSSNFVDLDEIIDYYPDQKKD